MTSAVDTISVLTLDDVLEQRTAELRLFQSHVNGNQLASVLAIKGLPGVAETKGLPALSGADGDALEKALVALGWKESSWLGVILQPVDAAALSAGNLRELVEIIDPLVVITLDDVARLQLIEALSPLAANLLSGFHAKAAITVLGRRLISVDSFELALRDSDKKQLAWAQLKQAIRP